MLFIYILLRKVYINRFKFITDILFLLFIGIILQSFIILALTICFIFFNLNIKSFLYLSIVSLFLINLDLNLFYGRAFDLIFEIVDLNNYESILFLLTDTWVTD